MIRSIVYTEGNHGLRRYEEGEINRLKLFEIWIVDMAGNDWRNQLDGSQDK